MGNIYDLEGNEIKQEPEPSVPKKRTRSQEPLTASELSSGKRTLYSMVATAFETLQRAMDFADYPTAVKAAQIILDRSGFGPKSTVDFNATLMDLSELSRDELAERALKIAAVLKISKSAERIIDSKPVVIN